MNAKRYSIGAACLFLFLINSSGKEKTTGKSETLFQGEYDELDSKNLTDLWDSDTPYKSFLSGKSNFALPLDSTRLLKNLDKQGY
ncbi:hypothetical protein BSZ32_16940 [Rubritalea profundi]|uniref:Uncharacterized protein n=1 Tax=Rubritalea profundi TaxID=1658618 RepID=A0A2S7U604_9BACT|nr:hypothetical protein BSZ32_16940 [Rubritalea profundi]